jgi:hypothetical protein
MPGTSITGFGSTSREPGTPMNDSAVRVHFSDVSGIAT